MAAGTAWLGSWLVRAITTEEAISRFDRLPGPLPTPEHGFRREAGLATGHPLDGLLEALGWYGKHFESVERVHPLLFREAGGPPTPLDPARMPVGLALTCPQLARSNTMRRCFHAARPFLRTRRPGARLDLLTFRGKASAAMIYHRQPITDHFRKVDHDRVLGLMVREPAPKPYYFFLLSRDRQGG